MTLGLMTNHQMTAGFRSCILTSILELEVENRQLAKKLSVLIFRFRAKCHLRRCRGGQKVSRHFFQHLKSRLCSTSTWIESYLAPTFEASAAAAAATKVPELEPIRQSLLPPPLRAPLLRRWRSSTRGPSSRRTPGRCRCCSAPSSASLRGREASNGQWPRRCPLSSTEAAAAAEAVAAVVAAVAAAAAWKSAAFVSTEAATNVRQTGNLNTWPPYLGLSQPSCRKRCWRAAGEGARPSWPRSLLRPTTESVGRDLRGWHCGGTSVWRRPRRSHSSGRS